MGVGRDVDGEFDAFVTAVSPRMLRTAYLLTGDAGHAEDLLQDALERTYRRWRRSGHLHNPEAYLQRTVTNLAINRWRNRSRRGREVELTGTPLALAVDDASEAIEIRAVLWPALLRLPPGQRAVLVLRYWADLSEAETAKALRCSTGTVKSQSHRGLIALRQAWGHANRDTEATCDTEAATVGTPERNHV